MAGTADIEAFRTLAPAKRDAALGEVFGRVAVDTVAPLSGGASGALIFRAVAGARTALLRIEGVPSRCAIRINTSHSASRPMRASRRRFCISTRRKAFR